MNHTTRLIDHTESLLHELEDACGIVNPGPLPSPVRDESRWDRLTPAETRGVWGVIFMAAAAFISIVLIGAERAGLVAL